MKKFGWSIPWWARLIGVLILFFDVQAMSQRPELVRRVQKKKVPRSSSRLTLGQTEVRSPLRLIIIETAIQTVSIRHRCPE